MSYLVANPEDRFSRDEAHIIIYSFQVEPYGVQSGSKLLNYV